MAKDGTGGNAFLPSLMTKSELRAQLRKRRRELSSGTQQQHADAFSLRVQQTRYYQNANAIACYWPVSGELDTRPLMHHAIGSGREVYLPVIDGSAMWFSQWCGEALPIERTSGLSQPPKRAKRLANVRLLDLVLLPLVAFTRHGARLGQGGGYYDRTFSFHRQQQWHRPVLLGAAHHIQETADIPTDPWDVPLTGIVTNHEFILTQ